MISMITENGKTGIMVPDTRSTAYKFKWKEGGEVPEELSGLYTSESALQMAWNMYQSKKPKKNGTS